LLVVVVFGWRETMVILRSRKRLALSSLYIGKVKEEFQLWRLAKQPAETDEE
jgi:hypothetical protein